jgi:hypothetical protein
LQYAVRRIFEVMMNSEFWSGALHAYYSDSVTKHHIIMVRVRILYITVELERVLVGLR